MHVFGEQPFLVCHGTRGALGSYPTIEVFFFVLLGPLGEDVPPPDDSIEPNDIFGDMPELELLPLLDIEPLRSLGDKLEFLLDEREELGLDTWLPFFVGEAENPVIDCFEFAEYDFDLTGTGLNVVG